MLRTIDIILILVIVSAAAVTYRIKSDSEEQLRQVRILERQIAQEEDAIDLLKADWSLLTQPSRIQRLVDAHKDELELQATDSTQVTGLESVPERGLGEPEGDPIADAIEADGKGEPVKVAKGKPAKKQAAPVETESQSTLEDLLGDDVSTGSVEE
ncbi:MAG: hypothetical protein WCC66_12610 [Rhizobiaceae bacterium]